jgi:hypothetical protein
MPGVFSWPGNLRDRWSSGFPGPRKPRVWYFHSKHFLFITCNEYFEVFFNSNRRKFNSEIQDPRFGLDVAMTLADGSDGGTWARRYAPQNTHDVTEVWRRRLQCTRVIQTCNLEKYCTVGLRAWQWQKFARNVRIKLFCRVWNPFQWCLTDRSPNYLGFFTKPRLILACDKQEYHKQMCGGLGKPVRSRQASFWVMSN